ncbi:hypothetical protein [Caulobacter sp. NIBR1757]|uniref:hypothetical protein n=1 Tax=Caulobacter sp. NIBR1757 TaxID=3016000 RepID=UPI0022F064A2|nr:hypothetical protein [Caulobacter sp. NIBR1757]WGM40204.1 hypothetical protein AMEJIAPC_03145 [Caulobacter sp. NIBR1757]
MSAADQRCALFTPQIKAALDASRLQARGAALRAGAPKETLAETEGRAWRKAKAVDCRSPDIATAAGRVRGAFAGYAKLARMNYPGEVAGWSADRSVSKSGERWKLSQTSAFGWDRLQFGLAGQYGAPRLTAVAIFADNATPYAARLVIRDVTRTSGPYLDSRSRGKGGKLTLVARTSPRSASRVFTAEARGPAGPMLLPAEAKSGWAFRFSPTAQAALAGLDPREAVVVEFVFIGPNGDKVRQAHVEVGDFAAGRAFLAAGAR